jgi:hypothetical protein
MLTKDEAGVIFRLDAPEQATVCETLCPNSVTPPELSERFAARVLVRKKPPPVTIKIRTSTLAE